MITDAFLFLARLSAAALLFLLFSGCHVLLAIFLAVILGGVFSTIAERA